MGDRGLRWQVDPAALEHNAEQLCGRCPDPTFIYGVVKADGYGLGIDLAVPVLGPHVDGFASSCLADALRICELAPEHEVLVYATPEFCVPLAHSRLTMTVWDDRSLELALRSEVSIAVKVDIGLGRIGFAPDAVADVLSSIAGAGKVCRLLYGHQSHPGGDEERTRRERDLLVDLVSRLRAHHPVERAMVASSAGVTAYDDMALDAVNYGHALYGFALPPHTRESCDLREATVELSAEVIQVRDFPAGERVGYGEGVRLDRDNTLAVVACGYGDGFPRAGQMEGGAMVKGSFAPFAVEPTVEYCVLDVTGIGCRPGDRAVFAGRDGIPFHRAAAWSGRGELELAAALRVSPVLG